MPNPNGTKRSGGGKRATAKNWKNKSNQIEDITLPSDNIVACRRPGLQFFLVQGSIPDPLISIVESAVNKGKGLPPKTQEDILKDPEKLQAMSTMMDAVVVYSMVDPPVKPIPTGPDAAKPRDPDLLYVDEINLEDKLFIFNYASGGTRDFERFRSEHAESMGDLQPIEDVELPAK